MLPFANLTGDASKEYLGDGMAEELINTLNKVQGLKVPARTSTFAYKGRNTDIRQIAKDLGVGTILQGAVRAADKRIRITAQLINAQDGLHIWSETYDEEFTDLFKLQDTLATAITTALQPNLHAVAEAAVREAPPTQDLEAYQLYLRGSSLSDRITESNENRAIEYFQQAIARDPKFARAYTGIARASLRLGATLGVRPFEHFSAAERAARQALALDPNSALAHASLSSVNEYRGNRLEAEAHSLAALSLGGNDSYVRNIRAIHQWRGGHLGDARTEYHRAIDLAPASPWVLSNVAQHYSLSGRDAEALKYADLAVELGYPKESPDALEGALRGSPACRALRGGRRVRGQGARCVRSRTGSYCTGHQIGLCGPCESGAARQCLGGAGALVPSTNAREAERRGSDQLRSVPGQQFPLCATGCR